MAKESGANDLLLRPLCARNLEPTLPEREGWVQREKLLDITGRGRQRQIRLAEELNISDYAQPAGGCCFLTDEAYSRKLVDLWQSQGKRDYELDDIMLLKIGRHLRPQPHFKMIIAREEGEGRFLRGYAKRFVALSTTSCGGPLALIDGEVSGADLDLAARVLARFSQGRDATEVSVKIEQPAGETVELTVTPMPSDSVPQEWYV